ncbi:MAG: hypothetical protein ACRDZ3_22260 [Acidimicrobiia bacterium]
MLTQPLETMPDAATVDRLSAALNRCFETLDVEDGVFTDDAFFDLLPPLWRFQLQGPDQFLGQLRAIAEGVTTVRALRVVPAAGGFILEHEETQGPPKSEVARRLFLCEVRDGRISEVVGYCNGGWDDDLRARHTAEAPMLRPDREPRA